MEDRRTEEGPGSSLRELEHQTLDYVMMFLRYHRPGFDNLPRVERTKLVADVCAHMTSFWRCYASWSPSASTDG